MNGYAHDPIVPAQNSSLSKKEQVAQMFNGISLRYDFLNRFLSAGIDVRWRKKALATLAGKPIRHMLDVATGTADLAILALKKLNPEQITGIDISEGMLSVGREKIKKGGWDNQIRLITGDSEAIPFPDQTFDAVTVSFGVRNFENLEQGLREIRRVLTPGGRLVVLEFSRPTAVPVRWAYTFYMKYLTPLLGKVFSGSREAYSYLDRSIRHFPEGQAFCDVLALTGYQNIGCRRLSFGICSIYTAEK